MGWHFSDIASQQRSATVWREPASAFIQSHLPFCPSLRIIPGWLLTPYVSRCFSQTFNIGVRWLAVTQSLP